MTTFISNNSINTATKWYNLVSECYIIINKNQALVIQRLDSAIQRINLYPVDSAISFPSTYRLYSDLSFCRIARSNA